MMRDAGTDSPSHAPYAGLMRPTPQPLTVLLATLAGWSAANQTEAAAGRLAVRVRPSHPRYRLTGAA